MKYDYEKYEPKQYKPYWWIAENFKFGFIVFVIGAIGYGVYELVKYLLP
jgi:hypothetical protein